MIRFLTLIIVVLFPVLLLAQNNFDSLLKELDNTVDNYQLYSSRKESEINKLKESLKQNATNIRKQEVYRKLFDEYKLFQSDSALVYARKNFQIAEKLDDPRKISESQLDLASIMGTLGMYKEATDLLNKININRSPDLKAYYFTVNSAVYGYMSDYAASPQEKEKYVLLTKKYRDSSLNFYPIQSRAYIMAICSKYIDTGKFNEALAVLLNYFPTVTDNSPDRAVIAYIISQAYHQKKDADQEKKWLIISALSDLKLAKKEYISLRSLGFIMYEEGNIDRSYKYMKRSLEDALFCNARLRTYEISKMMPIISEAYQHQNETNRFQLVIFLAIASVLSLILFVILFLLFKQMKKLNKAKKDIDLANIQLSELNKELYIFNEKLNETNFTLTETNLLKEIYIGRYMDQCSDYIGKLEVYRRKLNLMATTGKMNDLVTAVKSKEFIENELKEFYTHFDNTFLQLFPNFIREFASLLVDEDSIQLKEGELLNTELRIFALIRLGIKDSAKISVFLRYSVSTIYNYRSQIKNKATGPRDDFESAVMRIGKNVQ
jgi:predicted Holliday junction resolvase-like endonuclease